MAAFSNSSTFASIYTKSGSKKDFIIEVGKSIDETPLTITYQSFDLPSLNTAANSFNFDPDKSSPI